MSGEVDLLENKKIKYIDKPTRNEPTLQTSEFHLTKRTKKKPLVIRDMVKILGKTASHADIGKKLQIAQRSASTLDKPLDKVHVEKATRAVGFEEIKKKLSRWDAIVTRNRVSDHLVFPLSRPINKLQDAETFLSKFQVKSDLEKELEALEPVVESPKENHEDEFALTLEEMLEQRKENARFRARHAYQAAKGKRQNKIKSKKFHRIEKRNKLKQKLKEFELLQQTNPEEALKQLELIEKARAVERVTLRHKNTGQWAKSKLVRAKYDKETRQQLADQLAVSRDLTQKIGKVVEDDESDDEKIKQNVVEDPSNPWLSMKQSGASQEEIDFVSGYRKYWEQKNTQNIEKRSEDSCDPEKLNDVLDNGKVKIESMQHLKRVVPENDSEKHVLIKRPLKRKKKISATSSTTEWIVEEIKEINPLRNNHTIVEIEDDVTKIATKEDLQAEVSRRIKDLRKASSLTTNKKVGKSNKLSSEEPLSLEFKLKHNRPILDERLNEVSHGGSEIEDKMPTFTNDKRILPNGEVTDIDPNKIMNIKPKSLPTALPDEYGGDFLDDNDDADNKVMNIQEAFEEDDVIAEFRQEKEDEINKNKPKDLDLTLPGWGAWGGKNIKVSNRKRKRFIIKMPEAEKRRDENKGDVIIKEAKNSKLSLHKVSDVPFPFTSVKSFEASIRAPIGNTFITETASKKLTKPTVITKIGTIIQPMDEKQLINYKNKKSKDFSKNDKFVEIN